MHIFSITGPNQINGEINISGAKNAALPILFSSLLVKGETKIKNIPNIKDVKITLKIFKLINVKYKKNKNTLYINTNYLSNISYPCNLIQKTRASIWLLSALILKFQKIKINKPGGCKIGKRPIDLHIYVFKCLGIKSYYTKNSLTIYVKNITKNKTIVFNRISVGATITAIITSTLIYKKITHIHNIAIEPEVIDTINFLKKMGAKIYTTGKNNLTIIGVKQLYPNTYKIIPDRIETATFLIAAIILRGNITCFNTNPKFLTNILKKLKIAGAHIQTGKDYIHLNMYNKRINAININTAPYPGIPTDIQPQLTVLNVLAKGQSIIKENIFKHRFSHVPQLTRMGANIKIKKNSLYCRGIKTLQSAYIKAKDLRSSASLILAALAAHGNTIIKNVNFIYRGYENIIKKFQKIGITIHLIKKNFNNFKNK